MSDFLPKRPPECPVCGGKIVEKPVKFNQMSDGQDEYWECEFKDYAYSYIDDYYAEYAHQYWYHLGYAYHLVHSENWGNDREMIHHNILTDDLEAPGWEMRKVDRILSYHEIIRTIERLVKTRCMGDV